MFISFEGCEGSGKTTLCNILFQKVRKKFSVILTKEPGSENFFNIEVKKILFSFYNKIDPYTEALLYAADRTEHLKKIIIPALFKKEIVICDRYLDSSIAYQGYAKKLGEDFIKKINFLALQYLPQITFYLDLDPYTSINRLKNERKQKVEYFDLEKMDFHYKVREGFLKLCSQYPKRIYKLDANLSLKELQLIIDRKIKQLFNINI